ncbi:YwqJ-related putative deaminase [Streptomyces spinoverrucosus]|uniref:YwqJ-related putative deaminase n=1 Tax=Streptomyces spinoverrucosus TaxID=284043 RepID=UPI0027DA7F1F|nr:YwqJ-related putative deaminase [Streptomyces spinoverrucosus]
MIKPEQIPQFTGDLAQLETDYTALKTDAGNVRDAGSDVHSQFQGLSAYYQAPEAEQLFATTTPVKDRADAFADDLETVSGALSAYATEIRPLVAKLKELKTKAQTFVDSVKDDDEWEYDEDKVSEHNQLRDDITATVAAFWAAERTCHNKITALWGGTQMMAGDGSDRTDQYGFSAEDMKNAKLPWGDPVEEKHHWYEVGHWVKSFVWDGLIVDGIWGTIKGLGTLVGFGGWDAMGQAWKGLAQLATGLALSSIPGVGTLFWALPDDKLPSWIRDSRTAMKETGKALVAWDQWGKNPARAAGAVTFNVLTTVFTGGAGAAASGAGKAGAVARVLGTTARAIDPMTYIAKGAGAGLSKIGDISAALKGVGNIDIPTLPENAITLPEGAVRLPDGTVRLPEGAAVPPGATQLPDGSIKLPDDAPVLPEGTVRLPTEDGAPARYYDPDGNILDEGGNVIQKSDDGPGDVVDQPDIPPAGADVPRVDSPVREPVMAGAATHTTDNTAQHIRLGNSLDNVGDVGRVGDDTPTTPAVSAGGDIPNVHASADLPSNGLGNNLPGGGVGDNLPSGQADDLGRSPAAATSHDGPTPPHDGPTPPHDGPTPPNGHADDGVRHDPSPGGHGCDGVPDNHGEHQPEVPRTGDTPEGIRVEDDTPLPPPGAGDKNFGTLPEHRITVDPETQLITHIDDRPVSAWLDDLSRERGVAYREAKEAGVFSRKEAGECVGAVIDLRTGQIFEGINGRSNNIIPEDELHPTLAERNATIGDPPPHKDHPLGHAEVKAANQLLWERTKRGLPDSPEVLSEMRASVEFPFMKHKETGLPGRPAPFCANCNHMLEGTPSTHGRYTGFPPSDENWIP